ncbi:MAG: hypothetical protein SFX72_10230 [Isosphaeraceae bacterium]|nr:hypothetical protein [Isosphaeraceae bacterium]
MPNRSWPGGLFAIAAVIGCVGFTGGNADAGLIHQYRLDGSLADDFGGPSLVDSGGTLGPASYSFDVNQGLSVINALPNPANYSIEIIFKFSNLDGYVKILDFSDLASDTGLYNLSSSAIFYSATSTGPDGAFSADTYARLILTRDSSTNEVVVYVDGVAQVSFSDSLDEAVASGPDGILHFFKDDFVTSEAEASAGEVDLIRFYDAPLTASEVAALGGPGPVSTVPEPGTALLGLIAGLLSSGHLLARRRSKRIAG